MKHTPEVITELKKNEVFVFGSNESGIHGAGAAKVARTNFGAQMGKGFGIQGQSFAIPTKDWNINVLPLEVIKFYVDRFISFAENNSSLTFLVTRVGCGLAGYSPQDIGPLFANAPNNVILPEEFRLYKDSFVGEYSKVTRLEVINHQDEPFGRVFTKHNCKRVEASLQDDGRTLKIFISAAESIFNDLNISNV